MIYKNIKLEENRWNYNSGSSKPTIEIRERLIIMESSWEEWKDWCEKGYGVGNKIKDGDKIYFSDDVVFPRRKFSKKYPNNKLVSIDKADVVIIDPSKMLHRLGWYHYNRDFYSLSNGNYSQEPTNKLRDKKDDISGFIFHNEKIIKECISLMQIDKIFVDVKNVNLPSEEVMTEESFNRINDMLSSTDPLMVNMGMNLMTAYDMDKDKYKLSMLLKMNWQNWSQKKDKPNVEVKSFLSKMHKEFPSLVNNEPYALNRYWMNLILEHPEDLIVFSQFNKFIQTFVSTDKQVKLVYVDKQEQEGDKVLEDSTVSSNEQGS